MRTPLIQGMNSGASEGLAFPTPLVAPVVLRYSCYKPCDNKNLVRTTRFWNNLHRILSKSNDCKVNYL
jgi:hypothetical protein